jgi:hypothetical protein
MNLKKDKTAFFEEELDLSLFIAFLDELMRG